MDHIYQSIHGWMSHENTYRHVARILPPLSHIVEVGAWKGRSAAFLAVEIANTGKRIKFDVVDTWEGSAEHQKGQPFEDPHVVNDTLYEHFLDNMKYVSGFFNPIKMFSVEAAKLYSDNSLDFVFLDAGHSYEDVKSDIQSWLPKIKVGGMLSGNAYNNDWPGVIQSVNELLPSSKIIPEISGWQYIKT